MNLEPTCSIVSVFGGYVVQALTPCDCDNPECSGWIESVHAFANIDNATAFIKQAVMDYEVREETAKMELKASHSREAK